MAKTNCRSSFTHIPYMWTASQIQTMILCFIYQAFFKIKLSLLSLLEFIRSVCEFSAGHIILIHVLSEWMAS